MFESIFKENEIETNALAAKIIATIAGLMAVFSLLGVTGVLAAMDYGWCNNISLICSSTVMFICLLTKLTGHNKAYTKEILIVCITVLSGVLYFLYPHTTIFLMFGPILISIKYYDKYFTIKVSFFTWITYVCTVALSTYLDHTSPVIDDLHNYEGVFIYDSPHDVVLYYIIPRSAIYLLTAIIAVIISGSGRELIVKQIEILSKEKQMRDELLAASEILMAEMPQDFYEDPSGSLAVASYLKPAREVGGDFYDYYMVDENKMLVIIADVSDKGLPSALFSVEAKNVLKYEMRASSTDIKLELAVNKLNQYLCRNNSEGMFLTAWIACIDCRTGVGKYVNAGHVPPIVKHTDGSCELFDMGPQIFLGLFREKTLKAHPIIIEPGDTLILYTDGATDAVGPGGDIYGLDRLLQSAEGAGRTDNQENYYNNDNNGKSESIVKQIADDIDEFIEAEEQYDDITLLSMTYRGNNMTDVICSRIQGRAVQDEIENVIDEVGGRLELKGCPSDVRRNVCVAIDDICSNIVDYAYSDGEGPMSVDYSIGDNYIILKFIDSGVEFNMAEAALPDVGGMPKYGGLGIHISRSLMDECKYERRDGINVLTVTKIW